MFNFYRDSAEWHLEGRRCDKADELPSGRRQPILSAILATGAALGLFAMTSQVILGLAWAAAAIAAGSAALTLRDPLPRVSFGLTALLTGYLAWVALGPSADEELVYPFTALRLFPVVAILYVLAFWAVVRTERSAT